MSIHTHRDFCDAFLRKLALPVRPAGRRALAVVMIFESSEGNEKWNNPLAVTQKWPGSLPYNEAGVQIYQTFRDGVDASAMLYSNPVWAPVRAALARYTARDPILRAFNLVYGGTPEDPGWVPGIDFTGFAFNTVEAALTRLNHRLYGPND